MYIYLSVSQNAKNVLTFYTWLLFFYNNVNICLIGSILRLSWYTVIHLITNRKLIFQQFYGKVNVFCYTGVPLTPSEQSRLFMFVSITQPVAMTTELPWRLPVYNVDGIFLFKHIKQREWQKEKGGTLSNLYGCCCNYYVWMTR